MFKRIMRWLKSIMLKRMHRMITCKEFEDFIQHYLDGELADRQRAIFELHIRICRECREYLAVYQRTIDIGRATLPRPEDPIPEDVPEDLIEAILLTRRQ